MVTIVPKGRSVVMKTLEKLSVLSFSLLGSSSLPEVSSVWSQEELARVSFPEQSLQDLKTMIGDAPLAMTPRSPPPWYTLMDTLKGLFYFPSAQSSKYQ